MPITSVKVKNFRMIRDQEFPLGKRVTVVTGQNGSMKSTLLGMIAEPFRFRDPANMRAAYPMKTVDGDSFETSLKDTFKFSHEVFDKPGSHEWTVSVTKDISPEEMYTTVSEKRTDTGVYRFWQKGKRGEGSGHLQLPTIYLSLKRLMPIGEIRKIEASKLSLTPDEEELYHSLHDEILHLTTKMVTADLLSTPNRSKSTIGITTKTYDSLSNSAGQDNTGKIILALISFRRLKEEMASSYKGGLLLIDEIDATLYPAAQRTLVQKLSKYAGELELQVVVSTHSEEIIKTVFDKTAYRDFELLYLSATSQTVSIHKDLALDVMLNHLKLLPPPKRIKRKVSVYCEDVVGRAFLKALLPSSAKQHIFQVPVDLGWAELLELSRKKVPEFSASLIVLDGDVASQKSYQNGVKPSNVFLLPTNDKCPELCLFEYFKNLDDDDSFWGTVGDYSYQVCFDGYEAETGANREKVKNWFYDQSDKGGVNYQSKLIKHWAKKHQLEIASFIKKFERKLDTVYKSKFGDS